MAWSLRTITLSQLVDVHPLAQNLLDELGLPPPRLPDLPQPSDERSAQAFIQLAHVLPIRARMRDSEPNHLQVFGGVRTFLFLRSALPPETSLSVWLAEGRLSTKLLRSALLDELLLAPALFALVGSDLMALGAAWQRARELTDFAESLPDWSVDHLARFYRTSRRRLLAQPA